MARTEADFYQKLGSQLRFIRSSSTAYDDGHIEEAQRLSAAVSIILDSRKNGKSIIDHLGIAEHIPMLSTGRSISAVNLLGECSLTVPMNYGLRNVRHIPILGGDPKRDINGLENVQDWLDGVIVAIGEKTLSRRDVIRSLRDNDGGGHVDSERRNAIYRAIVEGHLMTAIIDDEPVIGLEWAIMRQIAYEAEASILYNYACRVNSKDKFVIAPENLSSAERAWIMPMAISIDMDVNEPIARIVMQNYGGEKGDVQIGVHAEIGQLSISTLSFLAKTRANLEPTGVEPLAARLSGFGNERLATLKSGALYLNLVVQVQYLSGPARPTEEHHFVFHSAAQEGFAVRRMKFPTVQ